MDNLSTGRVLDGLCIGGSSVLYIKPTGFDTRKGKSMSMTKKDYEGIANYIADARYTSANPEVAKALDYLTTTISADLKALYPRFDEAKFLSACQYGKRPRASEVVERILKASA